MKSILFNSIRRLGAKHSFFIAIIGLLVGGNVVWATDALSSWSGFVLTPPNIDATNFYNSGIWEIISEPKPFMTANTLTYTNIGTMISSIGWEFDFGPSGSGGSGTRSWSSKFFNGNNGTISTTSGAGLGSQLQQLPVGYLYISATNIVNKGVLTADSYSAMKLTGATVDLSRSILEILSGVLAETSNNFSSGNFTGDVGIFDQYWARSSITNMNSKTIWNGINASSPRFNVAAICGSSGQAQIGFVPTFSDSTNLPVPTAILSFTVTNIDGSTTNISFATNTIRQAVFVYVNDPNITGQVRFSPGPIPTNYFQTVAVQLAAPSTNFATLALQTNSLFLVDTLASTTNGGLLVNTTTNLYAECSDSTFRPGNYVLARTDPGDFAAGQPGAGQPTNNFLYENDFTNSLVIANYAGYSVLVTNLAVLFSTSNSVANLPGRVNVTADNLNLNQTRIRGEGEVVIYTTNLVSSVGAVVDCPNLSFNLGSTNGYLNVTNLALTSVSRLVGTVSCWSAYWTNTETVVTTNYLVTNGVATLAPLTNTVTVGLYALLVDASGLSLQTPVLVQDLVLHSTNIVVSDPMSVVNTLLFDGQSLSLNGSYFYLYNSIVNWVYTNAPALRYFTNNSFLEIAGNAHFGDDGPTNYSVFVNNGTIYSYYQTINADTLQINNGLNESIAGNFYGLTQTGSLSGAVVYSARDIQFTAKSLQINQSQLQAANALDFNVTGSLSDSGFASGNVFNCENGFNLLTKPATGDLLGTAITSIALGNDEVDHSWAGLDRGTNYAGFTNNVAVGELALVAQNILAGDPLFTFAGTGSSNALYVGYLDLSKLSTNNLAELQTELQIDPGMVIYYANAKVGFTLTNMTAAQYLNGQNFGGGQLKWIQGYTSQATKLSASYVRGGGGKSFQLTLLGVPGQPYIVQATTNLLSSTNWVNLSTNFGPSFTFRDTNSVSLPYRYYRVVVQ